MFDLERFLVNLKIFMDIRVFEMRDDFIHRVRKSFKLR